MPFVEIKLIAGRAPEAKRRLICAVTDAVERAVEAPRQSIRVVLVEIEPDDWGVGGVPGVEARRP